ncbi:MAG: AEC family transporter [Leucobacter sp.]
MLEVIPIIAPLFMLLGLGIVAGFSSRFRSAQGGLNSFVFTFSLPAFLFTALADAPLADNLPVVFIAVSFALPGAVALAVYSACLLWQRVRRCGNDAVVPGPLAVAATYGNVGYLGVPIAMSVIGPSAALAAALGQLLHNLLFMVGYPLLKSISDSGSAPQGSTFARLLEVLWLVLKRSVLLNPVVLGVAAGVLVNVLSVELPEALDSSITMLGQAAVPTAMFAVGLSIKPAFEGMRSGSVPFGAVLVASTVKLAVLPLTTLLALMLFGSDLADPWILTAVIMAAMPVSSTANILVHQYDGDTRLSSATTLFTSIAAIITVPAMIALGP